MSEIFKKNWRNPAAPPYSAMDEQRARETNELLGLGEEEAGETNELLGLREEEVVAFLWLGVFSTGWY
jgi:hypothetical protein